MLFSLAGGAGVVLYVAMAIFIPERPEGAPVRPGVVVTGDRPAVGSGPRARGDGRGALVFGVILIGLGAWFLLRRLIPGIDLDQWWPALLIAFGVVLLVSATRGRDAP